MNISMGNILEAWYFFFIVNFYKALENDSYISKEVKKIILIVMYLI